MKGEVAQASDTVGHRVEMATLVAAKDWSGTPLGPMDRWSDALRVSVDIVLASRFPLAVRWGPDFVLIYNDGYRPILGDKHPWALGLPGREAWAEVWEQIEPEHTAILEGRSQGEFHQDRTLRIQRHGDAWETAHFALGYSPVHDATAPAGVGGVFVTAIETTWRVQAEAALRASEERYQLALQAARTIGAWDWDILNDRVVTDSQFAELYLVNPDHAAAGVPFKIFLDGIHDDDRPRIEAAVRCAIDGGEDFAEEYRLPQPDGTTRWVFARGRCHYDEAGRPVRLPGATVDITDRKAVEQVLTEKTRALEILHRTGASITAELDTDRLVQTVTDAAVELTGAQFGAFFYNVIDAAGESYMLYALSGVPREHFSKFPMPRNTAVFAPTFTGEGVVRSDDITADPRYGHNAPRRGMPEGHLPVRSYLAVPVRSRSGEVLGGLFFGHSEIAVFSAADEGAIVGLAAQAAVSIDNARLFQAAQREIDQRAAAEAALHELNNTLEHRVEKEVRERARAEEALRQAQKMEAVGQLTGGVAHDFNNLLTVIMGGLDTIRRCGPEDQARIHRAADMAMQGAQRAASLTARLLAFSRRQPLEPRALDLNALVRDMTELLHRTLGETIELEGVLTPRLWTVEVDQNQVESAVLNLALNARDAMPDGGKLTIETANTVLDETYVATDSEVVPGQYVVISVSDNGLGMDQPLLDRVFEPFFTTKEVGKGTGLGLSMVYGFVKQSGGHVTIYSEPGQGTTVKLYFPRHAGALQPDRDAAEPVPPEGRREEVILVVEDNDDVRAYSAMILGELGYTVVEAAEADAALAVLRSAQRLDLLFTDVVLPGRSGRELAEESAILRPDLPVLFTTGYSRNAIVHHGRLDAGVQLLSKPFTYDQLATRVRDVLDAVRRRS
jgi:signal transduction histidine kinase/PAS domain-containing protein